MMKDNNCFTDVSSFLYHIFKIMNNEDKCQVSHLFLSILASFVTEMIHWRYPVLRCTFILNEDMSLKALGIGCLTKFIII